MKPPNALALKGAAVEEWVDLRFYRPLGAWVARALLPTAVTADEVTLAALLVGLAGGHLFLYTDWHRNALGFALLIVSDVLDSADGQLARLRGTSTRLGRALDGIGDNFRFVNIYVHLGLRLWRAGGGWAAVLLTVTAALSHSLQSAVVDFVRNAYLYVTGNVAELDLPEDLEAAPARSWWRRVAARIYRDYVGRQAVLLPRTASLMRLLRRGPVPEAFAAEYVERQTPLLALCPWLGQNIRFALIGITALAGHPAYYLWAEAAAMNVLFALLAVTHEWNATALRAALADPGGAYA